MVVAIATVLPFLKIQNLFHIYVFIFLPVFIIHYIITFITYYILDLKQTYVDFSNNPAIQRDVQNCLNFVLFFSFVYFLFIFCSIEYNCRYKNLKNYFDTTKVYQRYQQKKRGGGFSQFYCDFRGKEPTSDTGMRLPSNEITDFERDVDIIISLLYLGKPRNISM